VPDHKGGDGALHHGEHGRQGFGLGGEQKAQGKRKGKHPLSDRCCRKDMIDQVRGRLDHPPSPTAGAEATALAAERHQVLMLAAVALHAQKAVFQKAALQVVLELLAHESGKMPARALDLLHESGEMPGDNGVEGGLFRPVAVVGGSGRKR